MNRVTVSSYPTRVTLHCGQNKVTLRYAQKGERGIGISNVALDDKAHLIITYDDGKTQDAGAALGDVASVKDGIDSSYKKIQASEANVTKLEASTKVNADKAQQALQDTQSASASGVNAINTLVSEKMTYLTSTFNSLLTQAKANIDQWERDAENKIHKVRTYSLKQIKTAHDDAMVDIERSVNKAEAWAVSETTPDKEPDFESPTGLTQSSRSWALLSKKKVQEAYDTLKDIKDNETKVSNMKNDVAELLSKTQASEQTTRGYMNAASTSATNASVSASNAAQAAVTAKTAQAAAEKARDDANSAVDKVTGAMKYAGQVDNYSDLANVTKNTGDVWNIVNADPAHGIKAGDNVAWNGTEWDSLSGTVDLSAYAEKADYQKVITSATANGAAITFNHKDGTTSTATVNNVASATAATNDAKGQKIDTTYEKISDASSVHTSLQNSINSLSAGKQDKLTFDSAPTANSNNPVTSSGIKTALDSKPSNTGAGASGTWPIDVSGKAERATTADTIVSSAATETSTAERPVWLSWDGDNNKQVVSPNLTYNCSTKTLTADNFNGNLTGNASTATKAIQDASGNNIETTYATKTDTANTYIKSVTYSGHTVTVTKGNGTTSTFDTVDTTYPVATTTDNGLMSSADKTKLNEIATGAEVNQNAFGNVSVGTSTLQADNKQDTLYLATGDNISITADETNDKITVGLTGVVPVKNGGTGANSLTSITVGKATADASGNVITTTYATKAYADKVANAAEDKAQDLYNQLYLPRYNLYIRSALPTSAKTSITINPMALTINGSTYDLIDAKTLSLNDSSSWDSSTYATAANRAGKDFYIYACQPTSGTSPNIILSANGTVPTGYTALTSRKIGGFHCECLNVGTVTDGNPMNGYATGDIIPYSIWDLKHRPKCNPEGMVYVEPLNVWISIYIMSWDGSKLVSTYNGVQADGVSAKAFSGTEFAEYLAKVNMRLPKYDEYVIFAKGIEERVNVKGAADVNTTGGHYTTNSKRIVSNYGIEDCAGVIWQWLSDVFGSDFVGSWNTSSNRDARNIRGDCWGGGLRRALAGGGWNDGAYCGSRASSVSLWSAAAHGYNACRGASEPAVFEY